MEPNEIRKLREEMGWSKRTLAEHLKISYNTVYSWENGKAIPSNMGEEKLRSFAEFVKEETIKKKEQEIRIKMSNIILSYIGKYFELKGDDRKNTLKFSVNLSMELYKIAKEGIFDIFGA